MFFFSDNIAAKHCNVDLPIARANCNKGMDLSPYNYNFDLDKSKQKFHHSLKEHHKISNIPKFRCEML
jgi:hypothetical protein